MSYLLQFQIGCSNGTNEHNLVPHTEMIRLRPTSLGISDSDIQFHLRQADLCKSLLQEGFKKGQIKHFYDEHQEQIRLQQTERENESNHIVSSNLSNIVEESEDTENVKQARLSRCQSCEKFSAIIDVD